jgi:hypothetical protein
MKENVAVVLSALSMMSAMTGNPMLPYNHSHDHEYRDKVKTHYKGMSAEEMGTSHKRKSRRNRRRCFE